MKSMKIIQDESILIKSGKNYCRKINDYFILKNIFKFLMIFLFLFLIITQIKIINELKSSKIMRSFSMKIILIKVIVI